MFALSRPEQASPDSWSPGMGYWTGPLPGYRGGNRPSRTQERADAAVRGGAAANRARRDAL
eukprot:11356760-Alexandrium_andersonii.AAC.1